MALKDRAPMPLRVVRRARRRLPDATPLAPRERPRLMQPARVRPVEALTTVTPLASE